MRFLPAIALVLLIDAGFRAAAAHQLPADSRLEQKVTLRLKKTPLATAVQELKRQSGVTLRAAPEVADEPVVIFAFDQPAGEVMRQLARLFDYRWSRSDSGNQPSYTLTQPPAAKTAEEALRQQDRQRALDALLARLRASDPGSPLPGSNNPKRPLARLATSIAAEQWQALVAGRAVYFAEKPGPDVLPLPAGMEADLLENLRPEALSNPLPEVQEYQARETQRYEMLRSLKPAMRASMWLEFFQPATDTLHLILDVWSSAELPPEQARDLPAYCSTDSMRGTSRVVAPDPPDPTAEAAKWANSPLLGKRQRFAVDLASVLPAGRARLKDEKVRLWDLLPVVAETYHVNLVADAYHAQRAPALPSTAQELALYDLLDRVAMPVASWRKENDFIQLRSRTWYWDRLAEVPEREVQFWAVVLKRQRWLTLDETARLTVELRDEQLRQFGQRMQGEGVHPGLYSGGQAFDPEDIYFGAWEMLRVCAAMARRQQQALLSGGKVPLAELPTPARQRLYTLLERRQRRAGVPRPLPPDAALTLTVETRRREVVAADERTIQVRVRRLDGPTGEEPVPLHPMRAENAPPGATVGGEILQLLRFHVNDGAGADRETEISLTLPYFFLDPALPPLSPSH